MFLIFMFEKGYLHSFKNMHSALFFIRNKLNIGSDDYLSRLFKYILKTFPALSRYFVKWDINKCYNS